MNDTERFGREQEKLTREIEEILARYLPPKEGQADTMPGEDDILLPLPVSEAMTYAMMSGGKRIRPLLMFLSFDLFGGKNKEMLYPFLAAIEMIHTYSLIHDDLPAMDNDTMRRGKKTCHVVYGEAMAILAGDGLLNRAYETALLASEACQGPQDMIRLILALRVLTTKAGIRGMVGGQAIDVASEGQEVKEAQKVLYFIQENKTAALIEAALMCGAILADARVEAVDMMERIGSRIGRAFQIRDDILDVTGEDAALGKSTGKDAAQHKLTHVSLYGMEKAAKDLAHLTEEALKDLEAVGAREDDLIVYLTRQLAHRTN